MKNKNIGKKKKNNVLNKNNVSKIVSELDNGRKMIAMLAPSFPCEFEYPLIILQLKKLGFDKVVELTFGAKMINRDYHKKLKSSKGLIISSACPGIVETIINRFPQYKKSLIKVDSPMIASARICRREYPKHKICFISPCDFKKIEAENSEHVDYVIDYEQLRSLFNRIRVGKNGKIGKVGKVKGKILFDRFYNDYTKIYPLSGGLAKTAHLKGVVKENEILVVDGILDVIKFLEKPNPKIRFLDVLFCEGGCIGGSHVSRKLSIAKKRKRVIEYMEDAHDEDIPECRKGLIEKAKGLKFNGKVWF